MDSSELGSPSPDSINISVAKRIRAPRCAEEETPWLRTDQDVRWPALKFQSKAASAKLSKRFYSNRDAIGDAVY